MTRVMHQCVRSLVVGQIILVILFLGSTIVAINKKVPIRVGWESKPRTYDPRYAVDANSQYLENLLHCSLLAFDSKGRLVNELAKTWRWKTPTTLELELDERGALPQQPSQGPRAFISNVIFCKIQLGECGALAKPHRPHQGGRGDERQQPRQPPSPFRSNIIAMKSQFGE